MASNSEYEQRRSFEYRDDNVSILTVCKLNTKKILEHLNSKKFESSVMETLKEIQKNGTKKE